MGDGMLDAIRDRNAVIVEVLAAGHVSHLWTLDGPTAEALRVRESGCEGVAPAVHTWVLLAFELFNGTGGLTVSRLFDTLERPQLLIALSLLMRVAMGTSGVESILESGGEDPEGGASVN